MKARTASSIDGVADVQGRAGQSGVGARRAGLSSPFRGRKKGASASICFPVFSQEPHSRSHLSRPEAQSLSPYTTSANRAKLLAKNRQTFLLQTTKLTRLARRMCRDLLQPRRAARRPYAPINANAIKAECKQECWAGGG